MVDSVRRDRIKVVRDRILAAVKEELDKGDIDALEMLAVMAHVTGGCIALQNKKTVTRQTALDVVLKNLEAGNQEVVDDFFTRN